MSVPKTPGAGNTARVLKMVFLFLVLGTVLSVAIVGGVFVYFSKDLPNIITVDDYRPITVTRVYAAGAPSSGTPAPQASPAAPGSPAGSAAKEPPVVGEFYKELRYVVPYERIPDSVVKAFISAEDDTFFEHGGINLVSMIRAGIANFRAGHVVQGGSTITMQITKTLLLTRKKEFARKIREMILANRIESHLTKQQILYLYLNQIYLGHGAWGVQAASRVYFHKDVDQLTVGEAALLAGLPQAPSNYSPLLNPQKAKERQRYVLRRMAENGYLTHPQMAEALATPLKVYFDEDINKKYAPYYIEHIRRYLVEKYGNDAVLEEGLQVYLPTTPEILLAARRSLQDGLDAVDKRVGYRGPKKKLKTAEEMEKYLKDLRFRLIERKVGHTLLMPDGRLDSVEAMKAAGLKNDAQLLEPGQKYEAVVTSVDDKRKVVGIMIGGVKGEITMERMAWAAPPRDEQNPQAGRAFPKTPSKVLAKGDVIQAKVIEVSDAGVTASLDQDAAVQGALLSLDAATGAVLAMEGGYDFKASEFNRAVQAQRQPGSSFKPIIYTAAVEKGFNAASVIVDSPIVYQDGDEGKWKPNNFEEKFYGDTTFRQALIHSRNVPTIKIVQALQVPFVLDYAKRLGMNGQFSPDLSISLGSGAVSLWDLTRTYALFPRLGRKVSPGFIQKLVDREGKTLEEFKPQLVPASVINSIPSSAANSAPDATATPAPSSLPLGAGPLPTVPIGQYPLENDPEQVMDPRVAYVMTHLMKEVVAYGTGHAAQGLGRPAAGKTGTTNEYNDAWFMGFTPHVVTGVWVGFDNHKPIGPGETGAKAALPIWLSYMSEAVKAYPAEDFPVPAGVVFASINPVTGKLAPSNSSSAIKEAFIEGTQPTETVDKSKVSPESQSEFFKEDIE